MFLGLRIFKYVLSQQSRVNGGVGVKLSSFRHRYSIPRSTYYRAVATLVDDDMIVRIKRDRYVVSQELINDVLNFREHMDDAGRFQHSF